MIITRILGGLGNQMFQYAAGLALAEARRTVLKLDVTWFREYAEYEAHNRYALGCFNVTDPFATAAEIEASKGVRLTTSERTLQSAARVLRWNRLADSLGSETGRVYAQGDGRPAGELFAQPDGTYLDGMWQSEAFFGDASNLLRLHFSFRYPPMGSVAGYSERIRAGSPSAAVHFRRGDYVRNATFSAQIGVLPLDYYHRAVAALCERVPGVTLYIFSDDIDAIEREFTPDAPHVFVRATQPWHSHDKIRLMSQCDHAILSNSTFAWWGAWLGDRPGRTVIAPSPWLAGKPDASPGIVPERWIRLASQAQAQAPSSAL